MGSGISVRVGALPVLAYSKRAQIVQSETRHSGEVVADSVDDFKEFW